MGDPQMIQTPLVLTNMSWNMLKGISDTQATISPNIVISLLAKAFHKYGLTSKRPKLLTITLVNKSMMQMVVVRREPNIFPKDGLDVILSC
jgi:hypothetical protein